MRTTLALAGLALIAAALTAPPPAQAAPVETCQGKQATIVGGLGGTTGTEGDDVIVVRTDTTSLTEIYALGGDDTICLWGPLPVDRGPEDIVSFVEGGAGIDSLEVIASDDQDDLEVYDVEQVDLRLLGGDDRLVVRGPTSAGVIDGGSGQNRVTVSALKRVVADLNHHLLVLDGAEHRLTGFQKVRASAKRVQLTGSRAAEILQATGCRLEVRGGRGNDFLTARSYNDPKTCRDRGALVLGRRGRDRMRGTSKNDRLVGGPGRDSANGKGGTDRCQAEIRKSCER